MAKFYRSGILRALKSKMGGQKQIIVIPSQARNLLFFDPGEQQIPRAKPALGRTGYVQRRV
jgi:hypothetical protein